MSQVFLYSLLAALNPVLLAATTLMLTLSNPRRVLVGYLLGAYTTSIALGLLIVFKLQGSSVVDTAENTLSPAASIGLGLIVLAVTAWEARSRQAHAARSKKKTDEKSKKPPRWRQLLDEGKPRDTFIVGALLSLPGGAYLAGLAQISQQDLSTSLTVLTVLGFTIVMMVILEVPLLGYTFAPHSTIRTVERFQAWVTKDAHKIGTWAALILGALLLLRGFIELIS
jgi:hypothetical protein